ncbi:kinesin-like protein [Guillardia theta CCMP2712]|uniref:Kinesin-like protein n=1 Tax=Guillardia theta (strain CCMP2712) TaxID=905079 RepID=L1IHU7_GUITC|nr:kinesin-like protein [Guillardia theta CCMP2712]EKX35813.1 kinesin-like protein [Guillardia theta CCMP2712]|eukprot:XP_005822793.1 kinesin-like protein [Guillardia theta CCMP2712]
MSQVFLSSLLLPPIPLPSLSLLWPSTHIPPPPRPSCLPSPPLPSLFSSPPSSSTGLIPLTSLQDLDKKLKENKELTDRVEQLSAFKERAEKAEAALEEKEKTLKELEGEYKKEVALRKKYYNQIEDMKGKIRVYARCRPFAKYEIEKPIPSLSFPPSLPSLPLPSHVLPCSSPSTLLLARCLPLIFEGVSYLVQSAVDGYNVCIFAYGQTGSGKTFTMYGKKDDDNLRGIAPRAMKELYEIVERDSQHYEFEVSCYMLELYNDQLIDLLVDKKAKPVKLDIKLDAKGIVVVSGANVKGPCRTYEELSAWNEYGMNQRHVAATSMNAESSRSHLVFSVLIQSKNLQTGVVSFGKLTLVDLAGSERQSKTGATGDRLKEAKSINMSLSALGDVISALSQGEKFVPYRNNLLTRLLQDGIGGNAKTLMFVNISPSDYNSEETTTSLQYASRVKLITNDASKAQESAEIQVREEETTGRRVVGGS